MRVLGLIILIFSIFLQPGSGQIESSEGKLSGFAVDSWYEIQTDEKILEVLSGIIPSKNEASQFAFPVAADIRPENSGFWKESGEELVWTIGIRSKNAKSLNLILEPFKIQTGSYIIIYNSDRSFIRGAFGSSNNNSFNILPLIPVPGDEIILEYHIPKGTEWKGTMGISQVAHDYMGIFGYESKDGRFNLSQPCNVDINCDEGAGYEVEKRSVCRIIVNGSELCTGFLINNTNQQNRPLLVTAQHCIVDDFDASRSVFVFGYESPWCDGPDGRVLHSISGSLLRSSNVDIDLSLVELSSFPPFTCKPYLAGWDVTGDRPQRTLTIHHPNGDVKKITIDLNQPETSNFTGYTSNGFWKVLQWETGSTEGGSSGAPLFDQNKRVVGILTGGEARCGLSINDYFAKMSVAYNLSPLLHEQLKGWIDPAMTGLKKIDGRDPYAPNMVTVDTLSNIIQGEVPVIIKYPSGSNGYASGFNSDSLVMFAEYFSNPAGREVSEILINVGDRNSILSTDSIRVYLLRDGPVPGTVISSQKIMLTETRDTFVLKLDFKNTIPVTGNFYIGWKIWYKERSAIETRQFAVFHSPDRTIPVLNTSWFNDGSGWKRFTLHPSFPISVSMDVKVVTIGNPVPSIIHNTEAPEKSFVVYPNPAGSWVLISSEENNYDVRLEVYNSAGALAAAKAISGLFPGEIRIDLSECVGGLYYLVISYNNIRELHKIVVIR